MSYIIYQFFVLSFIYLFEAQKVIKIGAFFDANDADSLELFNITILRQNAFDLHFRLEPIIKKIESMDGFKAEQAVCEMVDSGAVAIIGPKSFHIADVIASICNQLNIPHIVSFHRTPEINKNPYHMFTRNIHPDTTLLATALDNIVENYDWNRFSIIYDSDEGLIRLNSILQMHPIAKKSVTLYKYTGKDIVNNLLKDIMKSMDSRIIIDCSVEHIAEIFKQGSAINMTDEYTSFFITTLDGHMLNIPELDEIRSNITAIQLMASEDVEAMNIIDQWKRNKKYFNAAQSSIAERVYAANRLKLDVALIRDSITVIYRALQQNELYQRINEPRTSCALLNDDTQYWRYGIEILQNIDDNNALGITGPISFDAYHKRRDFFMDVVKYERSEKSFKKVATWNAFHNLIVTRTTEQLKSEKLANIRSKTFKVVTRLSLPYLDKAENCTDIYSNDCYYGFVKDFLDAIASLIPFKYQIHLVPGNHHGSHDHNTGKWDGIVGEILDGKADLAVCDFTMTHERKTVIDFSSPFMSLGIGILFKKPKKNPIPLLNFLTPFSSEVWLLMSTALLCVSIAVYFLAKITEADWQNPHPCDEDPEELENIWNTRNCLWLSMGSIMQQGSDILPKGVPTRLTTMAWWFFAMIVTSSYTANLAAFLTKEQMQQTIENVEDLSKESKIKYGLMKSGSTETFFRESNKSIFQKMWAVMEHSDHSVFLESNEKGIERVLKSDHTFAFLMESTGIEYETQKECDLRRVGELLDSKSYAIGMPMNSPYRDEIDQAILKLKESRKVQEIKEKWWITNNFKQDENGERIRCPEDKESKKADTPDLDIAHIKGVIIVLTAGIGLAIFVGIMEFMWNVRKVSVTLKITPYEALRQELMFACKVWISQKPVLEIRDTCTQSFGSLAKK